MKKNVRKVLVKKKKDVKKARARLRRISRLLLFGLIVTGLILFARSSFFIVDKVNVSGNQKYGTDEILQHTGLLTGKNVFKMLGEKPKNLVSFRFLDLENEIYEAMPYIKSVSIRPSPPKEIKIKVLERKPYAVLEAGGTSLLIDKEGYALEKINIANLKEKYFKITGMSVENYKLGQEIKFKEGNTIADLISFNDILLNNDKNSKLKLFPQITAIDLSEINNIIVNFDNRITVKFGELKNADYNISFFKELFVNNITAKQKGTLDFTKGSNPYFVPES